MCNGMIFQDIKPYVQLICIKIAIIVKRWKTIEGEKRPRDKVRPPFLEKFPLGSFEGDHKGR